MHEAHPAFQYATLPQQQTVSIVTHYKRRSHGASHEPPPTWKEAPEVQIGGTVKTICGLTIVEQPPHFDAAIRMPRNTRGVAAVRRITPDVCTDQGGR